MICAILDFPAANWFFALGIGTHGVLSVDMNVGKVNNLERLLLARHLATRAFTKTREF